MMPTLYGSLPDPGDVVDHLPCRWCEVPTDLRFAPRGSKVGPVPLHLLCSAQFIRAYSRWAAGMKIDADDVPRLARMGMVGHDRDGGPAGPWPDDEQEDTGAEG